MPAGTKAPLRLFTTLDDKRGSSDSGARQAAAKAAAPTPAQVAALACSRGTLFHALSSRHDLSTSQLLIHCIAHGYTTTGSALPGFDRSSSSSGGSGEATDEQPFAEGQLAAALAEQLVGGWWYATHGVLAWRWQLAALLEAPCFGVPGLCRYAAARAAWLREQVQLCIDADVCGQVVLLRAGYSTLAHSLAQPGVKFFEVDARDVLQRKKEALDAVLGPAWRTAARRPRFVEVDFASESGRMCLLTNLTGAGFDPSARCCVVAEGLLPSLPADAAATLLADLAALCAPGSRLLFDFLHAGALEALPGDTTGSEAAHREAPPGLAAWAAAAASKGAPLQGGLAPAFSAVVRWLQPHSFRLAALLPPHEVSRYSLQQQQQQQATGGKKAASGAGASRAAAAGSSPPGAAAAALELLPYVPEYFSLACAVKADRRLLLRHADPAAAPAADAPASQGLADGWAALRSSALSNPSCLLRSFAFLFCGSTPAAAPAPPAEPAAPQWRWRPLGSASSEAAASPPRQPSADWTLPAGAAASSPGGSTVGSPQASGDMAPPELDHAVSIAALLPLGGRFCCSSSDGGGSAGHGDAGHVLASGCSSPATAAAAAAAAVAAGNDGAAGGFWAQFF